MKTRSLVACCLLTLCLPGAQAFGPVPQNVIITADLTDGAKWSRELTQWQAAIEQVTQQVERADQLIRLVGNPDEMANHLIASVPDLLKPLEDVIGLETRQQALKTANQLYHLNSVAVQTYRDINKVQGNYDAFGEKVGRDPKRYTHFMLQEAMNARYKQAVERAESVEKAEVAVQKRIVASLKTAKTQSDLGVLNGLLAASKQRLDLAHAKAAQAKGELDAFRGQLGVEEQRKAEADREWAQTVVTRMRTRALAAYHAQFAATESAGEDE